VACSEAGLSVVRLGGSMTSKRSPEGFGVSTALENWTVATLEK